MSKPRLLDLPHGFKTVIDEADWEAVSRLTLYRGKNGYVYYSTWANGKSTPRTLHGFLMGFPGGRHTDHINGDKLDNRRSNLRITTFTGNQVNRRRLNRNNTSGIRGVAFVPHLSAKNPWHAQIMAGRKARHLGLFPTKEQAIDARRAAELTFYGELCPT